MRKEWKWIVVYYSLGRTRVPTKEICGRNVMWGDTSRRGMGVTLGRWFVGIISPEFGGWLGLGLGHNCWNCD